jgi:DNA-directed RNA polymerase subunit omega
MKVANRFELVMLAAQRARNLGAGAPLSVDVDDDKNGVIALREIADGTIDLKDLRDGLIRGLQKVAGTEEPDGDELELSSIRAQMAVETGEANYPDEINEDGLSVEEDADLLEGSAVEDEGSAVEDSAAPYGTPSDESFANMSRSAKRAVPKSTS